MFVSFLQKTKNSYSHYWVAKKSKNISSLCFIIFVGFWAWKAEISDMLKVDFFVWKYFLKMRKLIQIHLYLLSLFVSFSWISFCFCRIWDFLKFKVKKPNSFHLCSCLLKCHSVFRLNTRKGYTCFSCPFFSFPLWNSKLVSTAAK